MPVGNQEGWCILTWCMVHLPASVLEYVLTSLVKWEVNISRIWQYCSVKKITVCWNVFYSPFCTILFTGFVGVNKNCAELPGPPLLMLLTWIEEVPNLNLAGHWLMNFLCVVYHSIMLNSRIIPYIRHPFLVRSFHFIVNNKTVIWNYSIVTDINNDGCVKRQGSCQLFE